MKLLKTFSLYTFIGFLNAGIGFLLLPVLTYYLTPQDYGIISLINAYVSVLMPVLGLSTDSLLTVEYYNENVSKEQFKVLFSSVRIIPLITLLPFALIFFFCRSWLPAIMEVPTYAYWLILPLTLFVLYQENFKSFLVATKRTLLFSTITLGKVLLEIPLTVLLILLIGLKWEGRIYAWLITVIFFTLVSAYFYKKWNLFSTQISKAMVWQAIVFGSPLILHQIGKFVINQSDRLFLAKMVSVEEMGIYSVGYQVGTIILIIVTAFTNFFTPFLFERLSKGTGKHKLEIIKASYLFLAGIIVILLLLTILSPLLFEFFINDRFLGANKYIFWVGLSYIFWGVYIVFTGYIFFHRKNRILAYLAIVNVTLNLFFNYFFIRHFGAIGAAYATCLSFFIVALILGIFVVRKYKMPWLFFLSKSYTRSNQ